GCDGNEEPFVWIDRDRVRSLDASEPHPQVLQQHRRATVACVHVEPYLFFLTECCDMGEWIDRPRRCCARRRDNGERRRALLAIASNMLLKRGDVHHASPGYGN